MSVSKRRAWSRAFSSMPATPFPETRSSRNSANRISNCRQLEAATAREAQARGDLQTLQAGGRSSDITELDGNLNRLKSDRDAAQHNLEALERLLAKQAATTQFEVQIRQSRTCAASMCR